MNNPSKYIILIYVFHIHIYSQVELVSNGDFENYFSCPSYISQIDSVVDWFQPTMGTPDYFNTCSSNFDVTIPSNSFGNELALNGEAYIGLITFVNSENSFYREYAETKLLTKMLPGNLYHVSMYVSCADSFRFATTALCAHLTENFLAQSNDELINVQPSIVFENESFLTNKNGWNKFQQYFIATNHSEYLTIGNFLDNSSTNVIELPTGRQDYFEAYTFIDSVSIKKITNFQVPNVFTPNDDSINDFIDFYWLKNSPYQVKIYNRWGVNVSCLNSENNKWGGLDSNNNSLSEGTYFYIVFDRSGFGVLNGFIQLFK